MADSSNSSKTLITFAWISAVAFALLVYAAILVSESAKSQEPNLRLTEEQAYSIIKELMSDELVAPSTAKFQPLSEVDLFVFSSVNAINNAISAKFWIDSQNSFGAMIRSRFNVMAKNENGEWVIAFIVNENDPYLK